MKSILPDFTVNRGLQSRDPILLEKTNDSVFDPPPPPLIPPSSTFDKQIRSSDGALKDIEPDHSSEGLEKADEGHGNNGDGDKSYKKKTAIGAAGI